MQIKYSLVDWDYPGIDRFLKKFHSTLVYQSPNFMNHLSFHLSCKSQYIVAIDQSNEIVGLIPFAISEQKTGTVINSLPYFGSNGGPIAIDSKVDIEKGLIEKLVDIFESSHNPLSLTIVDNPLTNLCIDYDALGLDGKKDSRISQITQLSGITSEEELLNSFLDPRPRNIRSAIKKGVTVRSSNEIHDLQFLHSVHVKNISAIGGIVKDLIFFTTIPKFYSKEEWRVYVAELNGVPIAGLLVFFYNKTVEYFTPAIIEEFRNTQALALVVFKAMFEAIKEGMLQWNWGGTWHTQTGVYDYKKRWNTVERIYQYHTIIKDQISQIELQTLQNEHKGFYLYPY